MAWVKALEEPQPIGIGNWVRQIYDDEVMFWSTDSYTLEYTPTNVSQYPLVPGFFITDVPDEYAIGGCSRVISGPFPTLETAIASIALIS